MLRDILRINNKANCTKLNLEAQHKPICPAYRPIKFCAIAIESVHLGYR